MTAYGFDTHTTLAGEVRAEWRRVRAEYGVRLDAFERKHYAEHVRARRWGEYHHAITAGRDLTDAQWRDIAHAWPRDWWYLVKCANAQNKGPKRPLGEYERKVKA